MAFSCAITIYDFTMYILAGMLVLGFFCNLAVHHVSEKRYMSDAEVEAMQAREGDFEDIPMRASRVIGRGSIFRPGAILAWAIVMGPACLGCLDHPAESSDLVPLSRYNGCSRLRAVLPALAVFSRGDFAGGRFVEGLLRC